MWAGHALPVQVGSPGPSLITISIVESSSYFMSRIRQSMSTSRHNQDSLELMPNNRRKSIIVNKNILAYFQKNFIDLRSTHDAGPSLTCAHASNRNSPAVQTTVFMVQRRREKRGKRFLISSDSIAKKSVAHDFLEGWIDDFCAFFIVDIACLRSFL